MMYTIPETSMRGSGAVAAMVTAYAGLYGQFSLNGVKRNLEEKNERFSTNGTIHDI